MPPGGIAGALSFSGASVMSGNVAFHSGGRMLGALIGGYVFQFGFLWIGGTSALMNLAALGIVVLFVREGH